MKMISITKYAFVLFGVAMLAGAGFLYRSTRSFIDRAATAEGTVVDLVESRSSDSRTWRPVVQFVTSNGVKTEFVSSAGSSPPAYAVGEKVEVLYLPEDPAEGRIKGFFSLWGGATIVGGMGAVFFLIGAGIALWGALSRRRAESLKQRGARIETAFQRVEQNTSLKVNGRHPYRIVSQWLNPATAEVHVFESGNLWFDPTEYIKDRSITVFMEQGNPKRYHVDVSFLPKLAT